MAPLSASTVGSARAVIQARTRVMRKASSNVNGDHNSGLVTGAVSSCPTAAEAPGFVSDTEEEKEEDGHVRQHPGSVASTQ